MRIILSPAKKMKQADIGIDYTELPAFLSDAEKIKSVLQAMTPEELQTLWKCNDKIVKENLERLSDMDLKTRLTPAVLSYDGIAYQYMAPAVFETRMLEYIEKHLRILSGFYGVLKPLDGVTPYRLEMQAELPVDSAKDLYAFWGDTLYRSVRDESGIIINLASQEYSKCIEKYLKKEDTFITCIFAEEENKKLVQKGVYCKMARGEMVRFMAEENIEEPEEIKKFSLLGYRYHDEFSSQKEYVFIREK